MSALDEFGTKKDPCPKCGGVVKWWYFDSDCRGNDSSGGIQCKGCRKEFTIDEWDAVEATAMKAKLKKAKPVESKRKVRAKK